MFFEDFNSRFKTVPIVQIGKSHKKGSIKNNISTLSHMHKEMEILLVLSGKAKFCVDSREYVTKTGDLILVSPYQIHYATVIADEDYDRCCLCFDLNILYDKKLVSGLEDGTLIIKNKIENNKKYATLIKSAYDAISEEKEGWEFKTIGLLSQFFGQIKEDGLIAESKLLDSKKPLCQKIMNYIFENFDKDISSNKVACELHINNSYFCRVFKKNFGFSFQDYLCKYRIEKAKKMLKESECSVSQIAQGVGFNSFSYFSKCFREYTAQTPTDYRKKQNVYHK